MPSINTTEVREFSPRVEVITAHIETSLDTGERFCGPLVTGFYPPGDEGEDPELWIEWEGNRIYFNASTIPALFKQVRRAAKLAQEHGRD